MTLFYIPDATEHITLLPADESKHAVKVLRLQAGASLAITNGKGDIFEAEVVLPHQKKCEVKVTQHNKIDAPNFRIHMAVAPTKLNDRYEWMLEKMTEIGVAEITPIICQRSERKVIKQERLERIVVSAVKQSWKGYMPKINPAIKFSDFLKSASADELFIAHCNGGCGADKHLMHQASKAKTYIVLIGPEGDFTPSEVAAAEEHQYNKIGLGPARLRTETAGLAACHTLNLVNG